MVLELVLAMRGRIARKRALIDQHRISRACKYLALAFCDS
jgi:hypothetical protein